MAGPANASTHRVPMPAAPRDARRVTQTYAGRWELVLTRRNTVVRTQLSLRVVFPESPSDFAQIISLWMKRVEDFIFRLIRFTAHEEHASFFRIVQKCVSNSSTSRKGDKITRFQFI
jgi:hypothetical protein